MLSKLKTPVRWVLAKARITRTLGDRIGLIAVLVERFEGDLADSCCGIAPRATSPRIAEKELKLDIMFCL